jgi:hypothetical protein
MWSGSFADTDCLPPNDVEVFEPWLIREAA